MVKILQVRVLGDVCFFGSVFSTSSQSEKWQITTVPVVPPFLIRSQKLPDVLKRQVTIRYFIEGSLCGSFFFADRLRQSLLLELTVATLVETVSCRIVAHMIFAFFAICFRLFSKKTIR